MTYRSTLIGAAVASAIAAMALAACGGSDDAAPGPVQPPVQPPVAAVNAAVEGLVLTEPTAAADTSGAAGKSTLTFKMLTQGKVATVTTEAVTDADIARLKIPLVKGALVGYQKHETRADTVKVAADVANTFSTVYRSNVSGRNFTFDSAKFGPELPPVAAVPGRMAAAGWVYAKDAQARTITIGDGNAVTRDMANRAYDKPLKRFDETYRVAPDVAVYNVNTADFNASAMSNFEAIPVTADYRYATTERQQAYLVFDKNHQGSDTAVVTAIYYFTPKSKTTGKPYFDIGNNSSMLDNLGTVPASESDLYAGVCYNDIPYQGVNYEQSSEPFEVVKDTIYSVGDNEVTVFVIKTRDKLILLDAGWPTVGYQYWKNIEAMGIDPRKITDVMLTHAHSDHYGTASELIRMIENSGGKVTLWGSSEENNGIRNDAQGNTWNKAPTLPASETFLREKTSVFYEMGKTYDFGNVKMRYVLTPGHTNGTPTLLWDVARPDNGQVLKFVYQGGYGWSPLRNATDANGWLRLAMQFSLRYLQQVDDNSLILPQHTDMSPLLEAYQAVKAYNRDPANVGRQKTVLDALTTTTGGANEFQNLMEKRHQSFANPLTDAVAANWKSVTTFGPYKPGRENGLNGVSVTLKDGGKIIRGFNKRWLINSNFPLLKDGVEYSEESYQHDPGAYYVQFYADVLDDATYKGFIPQGYTQTVNGTTFTYTGGPVESIYAGAGTPEIIRTTRLDTLAQAQAILASVQSGKTYKVNLNRTSDIVVAPVPANTFAAP